MKTLEFHLLDAGHFALATNGHEIAKPMREFLGKHVAKKQFRQISRLGHEREGPISGSIKQISSLGLIV